MTLAAEDARPGAGAGDDELVLVATEAMRARRAPMALLWLFGFQSILAGLAAWPAMNAVRAVYATHPQGDAPLWKPGGLALLDFLVSWQARGSALTPLPTLALAAAAIVGLVPFALLLAQMAFATRARHTAPFARLMPRALSAFGPLAIVLVLGRVVQLAVLGAAVGAGRAVAHGSMLRLGGARAEQLGAAVGLTIAALAIVAALVQDLASAAVVRFQVSGLRALVIAANTLRRAPLALVGAWGWRTVGMLGLVLSGSVIVERVGSGAGSTLILVLALHQVILFARLTLRASWLGRALRAVDLAYRVVRRPSAPRASAPNR